MIRSKALVLQYTNYMAKGLYSRRNIKDQFLKIFTVAGDVCFPGSKSGALIWIAFMH